jgi:hypothetical protein
MLKVTIPVEAGNAVTKAGTMAETIQVLLADMKPEAVYLTLESGQRALYIFLDLQDSSDLARLGEPWFLALNASLEWRPVAVPKDLAKAGPSIEKAAKKYK